MTCSFLIDASLPASFWLDVLYVVVFTISRLPILIPYERSPYEVLFKKLPDYKFLKPFGCACLPHLLLANKLSPRSIACVFLDYTPQYKGYHCFNPITNHVYVSWHVLLHETNFPFSTLLSWSPSSSYSSSFNLNEIF